VVTLHSRDIHQRVACLNQATLLSLAILLPRVAAAELASKPLPPMLLPDIRLPLAATLLRRAALVTRQPPAAMGRHPSRDMGHLRSRDTAPRSPATAPLLRSRSPDMAPHLSPDTAPLLSLATALRRSRAMARLLNNNNHPTVELHSLAMAEVLTPWAKQVLQTLPARRIRGLHPPVLR